MHIRLCLIQDLEKLQRYITEGGSVQNVVLSSPPERSMPKTIQFRLPSLSEENLMDPWEMFCELCQRVVEDQNVYLDVLVTAAGVEMMLMPIDEE